MRGRFRILVVDDDDNMLRSVSRMLEDFSATIDTATSNSQAFNRFKQFPYDLVSLDMNMPDFDGERNPLAGMVLLEKLRQLDPTLPAIILTGEDEETVRTMLEAKNLEQVDIFLKYKSSGDELCRKVDNLLKESTVSLLPVGKNEPVIFQRKNIVNLQGVIGKTENNHEGQVFIKADPEVLPEILNTHWLAQACFGQLREEPVDIVGVRHNKFVVVGTNKVVFIRDFYRNDILVYEPDLKALMGEVIVDERMNRNEVRIISSHAPEYLTSKKSWQAITDDNTLLPMYAKIDILGGKENKLRIRPYRTVVCTETGQEVEVTPLNLIGLLGKVTKPIDEEDQGSLQIIAENIPGLQSKIRWRAASSDENIFIPGERVKIVDIRDKKLLVREFIAA